jgi:hypothetical protein
MLPVPVQPAMRSAAPMTVAALGPAARGDIEDFVREALGCTCPPAVFENIRLETDPAGFAGIPGARLLAIGGRLLVLLVDAINEEMAAKQINTLLRAGRDLRDAGGFNRFRLVIVAPPCSGPGARPVFDIDPVDDRVHLHTLSPLQLPALLRIPGEAQCCQ